MKRIFLRFLFVVFISLSFNLQSKSQELVCLDCHENMIANSVHDKKIKCKDCHSDVLTEEHAEGGKVKKVECKKCHGDKFIQMQNDVHRKVKKLSEAVAPNCKTCHGTHNVTSPSKALNKDKTPIDDAVIPTVYKLSTNNVVPVIPILAVLSPAPTAPAPITISYDLMGSPEPLGLAPLPMYVQFSPTLAKEPAAYPTAVLPKP